jgi:redox-regulated HSP33 family molecular chaperone
LLETCKEQGLVIITCQFCDQEYRFDKNSIQAMFPPSDDILH